MMSTAEEPKKDEAARRAVITLLRPLGEVREIVALTGGMFASTYRVTFAAGTLVVAKLTGADPGKLCRYERGIARTEAQTYRVLSNHGLPAPEVLLTDFSHVYVDADVVVTRHLSGTPWNETALDEVSSAQVRRRLGAAMAQLHRIRPPAFGYPALQAGMQAATWRDAFVLMVEGLVSDAADVGTNLPVAEIRAAIARHADALDAVKVPSLVHADLWAANVFLGAGLEITGIIDTERTVWGDPLLDLVGADQLGLWDVDPDLVSGNTDSGGVLADELASPFGPLRFALCRLYFALILNVEIDVRGYDGDWVPEHRAMVRGLLHATLERLSCS
ncbi:Predicted kinase, aminoglycoside phosphotransferase (APT) family [Microbacterium azadirachtae]|nr:Predicted kinase, aminoglycoside phosphotransferase (APT) family [Microbacterium azadirachtae]SEF67066.1 Predicted kinase, aminoglycoside phosphotransferase (APT) family [Microbacterium azadirachtae]SEF67801.1 Predicted kinase, aminoglycoside phosphotransferase (APT) family [Microbacterium azadirachtae]